MALYPDWHARVNDQKAALRQSDPVFQQIQLPGGSSHVRFRYTPPHASWIAVLFALGCVGFAFNLVRRSRPAGAAA